MGCGPARIRRHHRASLATLIRLLVAKKWEEDHVADAATIRQQHNESIDADPETARWRHS